MSATELNPAQRVEFFRDNLGPLARSIPGGTLFIRSVISQIGYTVYANGIVNGYPCGGLGEPCDAQHRPYFRPGSYVTRAQLVKFDSLAAGWPLSNPTTYSFEDVLPGSTFYQNVETAYCHAVIQGFPCGGTGEPCDAQHRPYFRPQNHATRGQIAKIIYN